MASTISESPLPLTVARLRRLPDSSRIPSLDGLRAVSILIVIFSHFSARGSGPAFLARYAPFGVQIFFVISGYIITTLLLGEREQRGAISLRLFYLRRVFRIVPAAYCFFAVVLWFYWAKFRPGDVFALFTFTSNYLLGRPAVVAHMWSLSIEEQFYILWPITLSLFFMHRMRILVWALCLSPFFILGFHVLHWNAYRGIAFPTAYDSLALGCLAAVLGPRLEFLSSRWFALSAPIAILLQWFPWTSHLSGLIHVLFLWPMTHLCIAVFVVHAIGRRYWLLNAAPVVWIGTISYSLYLWQSFFIVEPMRVTKFTLLWIFASAVLSFYLIEKPFQQLRRRMQPKAIASAAAGA